jgi:poly(3-hydroxybutyrate) depolymerase
MSRRTLEIGIGACAFLAGVVAACTEPSRAMESGRGSDAPQTSTPTTPETPEATAGAEAEAEADDVEADPVVAPGDAGARVPGEQRNRGNSAGCGKASGTGLQQRTVTIAGKERRYLRFIPPTYDPAKPLALVIGLHGSCKREGAVACATAMRNTMGLEAKAAGNAIFVYPQALPSADPAEVSYRWETKMGSEDYAFFDALVSQAEEGLCIDRDKLFVSGFSLGARFTSMLGCYRGDTIRAIAPVAPGMNATSLPLAAGPCVGEVAVWEGLGDDDVDHREGSLLVRDHYRTVNGCSANLKPTTPTGCQAYEGCRSEVPVTWCTYAGGHTWPAIGAGGVWKFFAAFP